MVKKLLKNNYKRQMNGNIINGARDIINGDSITNITYVTKFELYQNPEDYTKITDDSNYSEFYKKYISKFEKLNNYAFSILVPLHNKIDETDNYILFGKRIIDWIFGLDIFPNSELSSFYNLLKKEFGFKEESLICKRWNANLLYFNGNQKETIDNYNSLLDSAETLDSPSWFIDDICIDGRNILHKYEYSLNKFSFGDKYQQHLDANDHKLSYPDVDRIKADIFDDLLKNVFDNKNKFKYTEIYGIGLEKYFNQIQDLIFLTIFYGSITHLELIRKIISNVMYIYADTFEYEDFYEMCLKMLYLSGDYKKFEKLYNKIILKFSFVNSEKFINDIINSNNSLFEFNKQDADVFLLKQYGYYLSDKYFDNYLNATLDICKNDEYPTDLVTCSLRAISKNINRITNISGLLDILMKIAKNRKIVFFNEICKILDQIHIEMLNKKQFKSYVKILDLLIKDKKNIGFDLSGIIVAVKKRNVKIKKYDKYLNEKDSNENITYNIAIKKDELEAIKSIISIYKTRHERQEENPHTIAFYGAEYNIGTDSFNKDIYPSLRNVIVDDYIPLSECILLSKNETCWEKIKHLKILTRIANVESDEKVLSKINEIVSDNRLLMINKSEFGLNPKINKSLNELEINKKMIEIVLDKSNCRKVLFDYINRLSNNEECIEEVLDCINILGDIDIKLFSDSSDFLYIIFNITYQKNDIDIKNASVIMSRLFYNSEYDEHIIKLLEQKAPDISIGELKGYYQLINKCNAKQKDKYKTVIDLLKKHRNHFIKNLSNEYL